MPWCEDCAKFWNPNSMPPDGTCPTCHRPIGGPPTERATRHPDASADADPATPATVVDDQRTKVPWHFWVMVACVAVYLGWRVIQLLVWAGEGIFG